MNNIKSGLVIAILLGILYGVYNTLSKPDPLPPAGMTRADIENLGPPKIDDGPDVEKPDMTSRRDDSADTPALPPNFQPDPPQEGSPADVVPPEESSPALDPVEPPGENGSIYGGSPEPRSPAEDNAVGTNPIRGPKDSGNSRYANPFRNNSENVVGGNSAPPLNTDPNDGSFIGKAGANMPLPPSNPIIEDPAQKIKIAQHDFTRAMESARMKAEGQHFREALAILSPFYTNAHLPPESRETLLSWLDALAARTIYSPEHLLEQAYVVQGKEETLYTVAEKYEVPFQLLQNINAGQVQQARILLPGSELKVVRGPFRAEVDLTRSELTLFLGELYAGRFPFTRGEEFVEPGNYSVQDKQNGREYYGVDRTIAGNDPSNPYGACWLGLENGVCIHGSPPENPAGAPLGCISLSPRDANDVFGILSKGSAVVVRR